MAITIIFVSQCTQCTCILSQFMALMNIEDDTSTVAFFVSHMHDRNLKETSLMDQMCVSGKFHPLADKDSFLSFTATCTSKWMTLQMSFTSI